MIKMKTKLSKFFAEVTSSSKFSILVLPLAKLRMFRVAMAKVLVLIPPPVEAGDAPTHIRNKTIMVVGNSIDAGSMVLNPAVLGVVAPKSAEMIEVSVADADVASAIFTPVTGVYVVKRVVVLFDVRLIVSPTPS